MFEASGITSGYGEVVVLKGLDFKVEHEIFAILGANGAGKSTLMKTASKLLPLMSGRLRFKGEDVTGCTPYQLAARGLSYVAQEENVFPNLTVKENLQIGGLVGKRPVEERMSEVFELFPDIRERLEQRAGTLSGGESQMVAVGRALMQDPDLLLLDEPTAGLSPKYVDGLFNRIREIHETRSVSIVLAEQNAVKTMAIADRVMVLSLGETFLIENTKDVDLEELTRGYRI